MNLPEFIFGPKGSSFINERLSRCCQTPNDFLQTCGSLVSALNNRFVNFLNVQKTGRLKIPSGIAHNDREEKSPFDFNQVRKSS
jgi:hypothetical protein